MRIPDEPILLSRRSMAIWLASVGASALATAGTMNPDSVPEAKRSKAGLYIEARDVPAFIEAQGGPSRVLFLDVRTRAEAMFVGMATSVDALVPFVDLQELMSDWDAQRKRPANPS